MLTRNRSLGRTDIVYFLTIVHSMVHTVALATSLQVTAVQGLGLEVSMGHTPACTGHLAVDEHGALAISDKYISCRQEGSLV